MAPLDVQQFRKLVQEKIKGMQDGTDTDEAIRFFEKVYMRKLLAYPILEELLPDWINACFSALYSQRTSVEQQLAIVQMLVDHLKAERIQNILWLFLRDCDSSAFVEAVRIVSTRSDLLACPHIKTVIEAGMKL